MLARQLRTAKERTRHRIALVFSILCWLALLISIVGALYGILIAAGVAVAQALWLAHVTGNGVRVGPQQLPALWARIEAAARKLGLQRPPEAYVMQAGGLLNAMATKLLSRRFIIICSDLIDTCEAEHPSLGDPQAHPTELDFVIGHEIGHLACGHLSWLLLPARIVPLLGPAYSRACEYTSDACGHAVVGDLEISSRALAILAGGSTVGRLLDLDAFVQQRTTNGTFWMAVYELNATHPYLPKRIAALRDRERPGWAPSPGRNPASYPLAPFFAFATGGPAASAMLVVALIGIYAAIAIPAFTKYVQRSRQAAAAVTDAPTREIPRTPGASENRAEEERGSVHGDQFAWRMKLASEQWRALPDAMARRQNPLADRWITRPDIDAHVMVIAERAPGISLDVLTRAVISNAEKSVRGFRILSREPWPGKTDHGRILRSRGNVNGLDVEYVHGLLVDGGRAFQVVAFASHQAFPKVKDELLATITSFEPAAPGDKPEVAVRR
jgi:Zn-dependent protease with chaperone function